VRLTLAYGERGLSVEVPSHRTTVVEPEFRPGLADAGAALVEALRSPIAGPPLAELARGSARVAISVCDITRAQPRPVMLGAVLSELEGVVDPGDVVILVATGTHRPNTTEELRAMLGPDILDRYRVVNHDATDRDHLVDFGVVGDQVPASLNRTWVEADLRITTGFVEPHFFAGFSGGPKMVAPGLAGLETTLALHDARRIASPDATWGVIEKNPVQEGLRAVVREAPPHFSLDVVLNSRQEIYDVFAGEVWTMHDRACATARRVAMQEVPAPFDVVLTTNSGYPLDQNLYQAVKGMSAAAKVVRPGGLIVCASECRDGLPDRGGFARLLADSSTPEELLEMIESPGFSAPDQWQVQIQAQILNKARVALKSDFLAAEQIRAAHLEPTDDVVATVVAELDRLGPDATLCVLPEGPQTIPYLAA
jgi:nickel-dependent lactate racemase